MPKTEIKINKDLPGHKKGKILGIYITKNGKIQNLYWRNRFKDAEIDNCVAACLSLTHPVVVC